MPLTEIGKITKVKLYDNELYGTKNERITGGADSCKTSVARYPVGDTDEHRKNPNELLLPEKGITLEELPATTTDETHSSILRQVSPLWAHVPRGEVIAKQFIDSFQNYTPAQQQAFLEVTKVLGHVTTEILAKGPLDREAAIDALIAEEDIRFGKKHEAEDSLVTGQAAVHQD